MSLWVATRQDFGSCGSALTIMLAYLSKGVSLWVAIRLDLCSCGSPMTIMLAYLPKRIKFMGTHKVRFGQLW